jgi:hypothetical protein
MLRSRVYVIVCMLFGVLAIHAGNVIVGVNAYGADIRQMADSSV